jgi:HEAT repeat protein
MMQNDFLAAIQSSDKDVRFEAWRGAGGQDPAVIAQLAPLTVKNDNPGVAKAAREAIITLTHAVGADVADARRAAVEKQLLALTGPGSGLGIRVLALRMLSNIGGDAAVPVVAKLLADKAVQEEAVFALERIPGAASEKALLAAYGAAGAFQPRVLAALAHRKVEAAVPLCLAAMRSPAKAMQEAGGRALARIGKRPADRPLVWNVNTDPDNLLRFADARRDQGLAAEAIGIYKSMLARSEEHLQCAAVVGLAKTATPEAAAALLPALKHRNARVRLTAQQAWKRMASTSPSRRSHQAEPA